MSKCVIIVVCSNAQIPSMALDGINNCGIVFVVFSVLIETRNTVTDRGSVYSAPESVLTQTTLLTDYAVCLSCHYSCVVTKQQTETEHEYVYFALNSHTIMICTL